MFNYKSAKTKRAEAAAIETTLRKQLAERQAHYVDGQGNIVSATKSATYTWGMPQR